MVLVIVQQEEIRIDASHSWTQKHSVKRSWQKYVYLPFHPERFVYIYECRSVLVMSTAVMPTVMMPTVMMPAMMTTMVFFVVSTEDFSQEATTMMLS